MTTHQVVLIPGDGIGPEVTAAVQRVLVAADAPIEWVPHQAGLAALETGNDVLPDSTIDAMSPRVGSTSQKAQTWSDVDPGAMWPGQRATRGTRIPPSQRLPLRPRKIPADRKNVESEPPRRLKVGPLSEVKNTRVRLSRPSSFTTAMIFPMSRSM